MTDSVAHMVNAKYTNVMQEVIDEFVNDKQTDSLICVACGKNESDNNSMICKECKNKL